MLTWTDLELHVAAARLHRWTPDGRPPLMGGRALYMTPDVYEAFQVRRWPASEGENPRHTAERRLAMRAVLIRYVSGKALLIRRDLKELGSGLEGPVVPHMRGYWEFRSQGRMEETRLFGFFARPGAFVATDFKARGEFRDGNQSDWDDQHLKCEGTWNGLFPTALCLCDPWPVRLRSHLNSYLEGEDD